MFTQNSGNIQIYKKKINQASKDFYNFGKPSLQPSLGDHGYLNFCFQLLLPRGSLVSTNNSFGDHRQSGLCGDELCSAALGDDRAARDLHPSGPPVHRPRAAEMEFLRKHHVAAASRGSAVPLGGGDAVARGEEAQFRHEPVSRSGRDPGAAPLYLARPAQGHYALQVLPLFSPDAVQPDDPGRNENSLLPATGGPHCSVVKLPQAIGLPVRLYHGGSGGRGWTARLPAAPADRSPPALDWARPLSHRVQHRQPAQPLAQCGDDHN